MWRKIGVLVGLFICLTGSVGWFFTYRQALAVTEPLSPTAADLQISKSAKPNQVTLGDPLTYTLVVRNIGPSVAFSLTIRDTLPTGVNFNGSTSINTVGGFGSNLALTPKVLTGTVSFLEPGGIVTITARTLVIAATGSAIVNQATVSASNDDNASNNSATISTSLLPLPPTPTRAPTPTPTPAPVDLRITKSSTPDTVHPGQLLTYTILVRNLGVLAVSNIVLSDTLPAGVSFDGPSNITVERGSNPSLAITGTILSARIAQLNPGGTITVTGRTLVGLNVSGTVLNNIARMTTGAVGAEKQYSASTTTVLSQLPTPTPTPLADPAPYKLYSPLIQR